jgi:hypothetical protein
MEQPGPHDRTIGIYLDMLGVVIEAHPDTIRRRRTYGFRLSSELEKMEGQSFELIDDGDNPIGIGLVGPAGLTIVSLDPESNIVTTRAYGHLREAVLTKTGPIDDGDWNTSYRMTIEHDRLPRTLTHQAGNEELLDQAGEAFVQSLRA